MSEHEDIIKFGETIKTLGCTVEEASFVFELITKAMELFPPSWHFANASALEQRASTFLNPFKRRSFMKLAKREREIGHAKEKALRKKQLQELGIGEEYSDAS